MSENSPHIVFFDGVCGLCNLSVDWLMQQDKKQLLRFAPLQGPTAAKLLSERSSNLSSVVFWSGEAYYEKSDALLKIMALPGMRWKWLLVFRIIPRSARDFIYDIIARNRYKWWGKKETCRIPSHEEKNLFLN